MVGFNSGVVFFYPLFPGCSQFNSSDAGKEVCVNVVAEEFTELTGTNEGLEVGQSLEAFLVGDFAEGVVRVVAFKNWVEAAVCSVKTEADHVAPERCVTELCFNECEVSAIKLGAYFTFEEDGKAFVEPEAFPVSASDSVSSP